MGVITSFKHLYVTKTDIGISHFLLGSSARLVLDWMGRRDELSRVQLGFGLRLRLGVGVEVGLRLS